MRRRPFDEESRRSPSTCTYGWTRYHELRRDGGPDRSRQPRCLRHQRHWPFCAFHWTGYVGEMDRYRYFGKAAQSQQRKQWVLCHRSGTPRPLFRLLQDL
ncbi:hypothetical protein M441DRAFT_396487 [Trichoderma asperellum CBS 433.97]|uniref:Uncharacterized protein n=1 Tax=Trichoderma asperellum (strain ATCC 204424 / CBS 433.97 / NBRC 101777) TaxID=1042311 RepID=A0A2T3Z966_TRIA4|nr:hypothetical protein M441DRAFT_396487 [Trichoderma asperellum CBS 433.97]PTB41322.1 hypothetical protein M441DRAFT_396487 [Trichoderma asperellum CBS 433.97]